MCFALFLLKHFKLWTSHIWQLFCVVSCWWFSATSRKNNQELLTSLWLLLSVSIPFTPVAVLFYQSPVQPSRTCTKLLNFVCSLWQVLQLVALSPMRLSWCWQLPCGCFQQLSPRMTCVRASLLPADAYLEAYLFRAWSWDVGLFNQELKSGVFLQGSNFWQRGRWAAGSSLCQSRVKLGTKKTAPNKEEAVIYVNCSIIRCKLASITCRAISMSLEVYD